MRWLRHRRGRAPEMDLSFLQVPLEAMDRVPDLAALLEVPDAAAGCSYIRMVRWAGSRADDEASLGVVAATSRALAERAAGWAGAQGAFLDALVSPDVRLADAGEGGEIRLRHLECYASLLAKREVDKLAKRQKRAEE